MQDMMVVFLLQPCIFNIKIVCYSKSPFQLYIKKFSVEPRAASTYLGYANLA